MAIFSFRHHITLPAGTPSAQLPPGNLLFTKYLSWQIDNASSSSIANTVVFAITKFGTDLIREIFDVSHGPPLAEPFVWGTSKLGALKFMVVFEFGQRMWDKAFVRHANKICCSTNGYFGGTKGRGLQCEVYEVSRGKTTA